VSGSTGASRKRGTRRGLPRRRLGRRPGGHPPRATWSALPDLLPLLLDGPEPVPVLVARVDKNGGEILLTDPADGQEDPQQVENVEGERHPTHKVRGGGLKHLKMQHTVENTWRSNVSALAERIDRQVEQSGARVLVLAGEAQSRKLLRDNLGERSSGIATEVEHSGLRSGGTTPSSRTPPPRPPATPPPGSGTGCSTASTS
jgi:hypothetical protein